MEKKLDTAQMNEEALRAAMAEQEMQANLAAEQASVQEVQNQEAIAEEEQNKAQLLAQAQAEDAQAAIGQGSDDAYDKASLKKNEKILNEYLSLRRWCIIMIAWDLPASIFFIGLIQAGIMAISVIGGLFSFGLITGLGIAASTFVVAMEVGITAAITLQLNRKITAMDEACKVVLNVKRGGKKDSDKAKKPPTDPKGISGTSLLEKLLIWGLELLPITEALPGNSLWATRAWWSARKHHKKAEKEVSRIKSKAKG